MLRLNLNEVKYKDLNKLSKIKKTDDLEKAAHSQGYSAKVKPHPKYGSHSVVDLKHQKSGEDVKKPDGREIGGKKPGAGGKITDTTVINTTADAIKSHINKIGRTDKTEKPTKDRRDKHDALAAAKRAKQAARPFGGKNERHGGSGAAPKVHGSQKPDPNSNSSARRVKTGWSKKFEEFMLECANL